MLSSESPKVFQTQFSTGKVMMDRNIEASNRWEIYGAFFIYSRHIHLVYNPFYTYWKISLPWSFCCYYSIVMKIRVEWFLFLKKENNSCFLRIQTHNWRQGDQPLNQASSQDYCATSNIYFYLYIYIYYLFIVTRCVAICWAITSIKYKGKNCQDKIHYECLSMLHACKETNYTFSTNLGRTIFITINQL